MRRKFVLSRNGKKLQNVEFHNNVTTMRSLHKVILIRLRYTCIFGNYFKHKPLKTCLYSFSEGVSASSYKAKPSAKCLTKALVMD